MEISHENENIENEKKSKNILDNIKSKYVLQKIFNCPKRNKSLEIIRYNKKNQERMDLNINDFKEYCELYIHLYR